MRTSVTMSSTLAAAGRRWCTERGVGFGALLEEALPLVRGDVRVGPAPREVVRIRVDAALWRRELGRWNAAPGAVCDSAVRALLARQDDQVPLDLHG